MAKIIKTSKTHVLSDEEYQELVQAKEINKKGLFKTFDVMSTVGFIDFLDLATVFYFKVFLPTLFMAAIPYLMLETGLAALSNITTFWLVAHFDRYPAGHPKAGQMKTGNIAKAILMTIGASLIVTAAIAAPALPALLGPYGLAIFTVALGLGALHNIGQTIYNYFKYNKQTTDAGTKNIANKIYNHFFVGLALGLSLVGAVAANYFGMLSLGVLPIVGGVIGAVYCLTNLFPNSQPAKLFKNLVYRCLGLGAAIEKADLDAKIDAKINPPSLSSTSLIEQFSTEMATRATMLTTSNKAAIQELMDSSGDKTSNVVSILDTAGVGQPLKVTDVKSTTFTPAVTANDKSLTPATEDLTAATRALTVS